MLCVACGAYATTKPKDLLSQCKGVAGRGAAGAHALKCFADGRMPATGELVRGIWSLDEAAALALDDLDPGGRRPSASVQRALVRGRDEGCLDWAVRRSEARDRALSANAARPGWVIGQLAELSSDWLGESAKRARSANPCAQGLCVPTHSCVQLKAQVRCECCRETAMACKEAPVCLDCRKKKRPHSRWPGS